MPSNADDTSVSETQYLAGQAELAKRAMARAWEQVASGFAQGLSVGAWTREHPWVAVGTAATAGFAAGVSLIPSKQEQALHKLAELQRALNADHNGDTDTSSSDEAPRSDKRASAGSNLLSIALRELVRGLGPVVGSAISAAVVANTTDTAAQNGQHSRTDGNPAPPLESPDPHAT